MKAIAGFFKPAGGRPADQPYFELLILSRALADHFVDQPVFTRGFRTHEVVAVGVTLDFFKRATAVRPSACSDARE
jgi:hypothetical protein